MKSPTITPTDAIKNFDAALAAEDRNTEMLRAMAAEVERLREVNAEMLKALKHHQEQTRQIQQSIDVIAKAEALL